MSVSPQIGDAETSAITAPSITVATFNYRHGGLNWYTGTHVLKPAADHIASCVPDLDLLLLQEGSHFQRDGGRAAYRFAELLHQRLGGSWGVHLALSRHSPRHNLVCYRTEVFRVLEAWPDPHDPDLHPAHEGTIWLQADGLARALIVASVQWCAGNGAMRAEQAHALSDLIPRAAIIGGSMNCLWPGEKENTPRWDDLPPHLAGDRAILDPAIGAHISDLEAGLITWRQGWVDAGALTGDPTETTNGGRDPAPGRVDRIMVSPALGAALDTESYTVHADPQPASPISAHRLVSVRLHLAEAGSPFCAPWWGDPRFRRWTYGGATHRHARDGWIRLPR